MIPLPRGCPKNRANSKRKEVHDASVLGAAQRRLLLLRGYKVPACGSDIRKMG